MNEALQIEAPARAHRLGFAGRAIAFRTNSARIAELASGFFPPAVQAPANAVRAEVTLMEDTVRRAGDRSATPVFRGRNEYAHADYGAHGSVWFDLKARTVCGVLSSELVGTAEVFERSVLAVIAGILAPAIGVLALHSGCVVRNGKAVLIAAPAGTGKSTMTLALACRGWSLLSDDWTFLAESRSGLRAWGMPAALKLLPDAVRFFPELAAFSTGVALNGEESFELDAWKVFKVTRALEGTPAALILLERDVRQGAPFCCRIEKMRAAETRTALLRDIEAQPVEATGGHGYCESIVGRLARAGAYRATIGGEPGALAAEIDAFLREELGV